MLTIWKASLVCVGAAPEKSAWDLWRSAEAEDFHATPISPFLTPGHILNGTLF